VNLQPYNDISWTFYLSRVLAVPNACAIMKKNKANKPAKIVPAGQQTNMNNKINKNRVPVARLKTLTGKNFASTMSNSVMSHAKRISDNMHSLQDVTIDGQGFVQHIMNPCGEHTIPNSRCTDGTLSQSAVQTLRGEEFIVPPFTSSSTIPDTTKNWTLIEISPPTYTGVSLFIASADASQPTIIQWRQILTQINSTGVADYPLWTTIGTTATPNFYASYWRYDSANLLYDAATNQSTTVESFRYVGDGVVVQHNCPTLWDQGGFVTGQFQCDTEYVADDGEVGGILIQTTATSLAGSQLVLTNFNISEVLGESNFAQAASVIVNSATPSVTVAAIPFPVAYSISKPDGNFLVNVAAGAAFNWTIAFNSLSDPGVFFLSSPTTVGGPMSIPVVNGAVLSNTEAYSVTPVLGAIESTASIIIDLPSLDWARIVQADPKRASERMKGHGGFYAVRRYFQPKLLMSRSNRSGNIKFSVQGMNRLSVLKAKGGILADLVDENASIRISVIRGISYAAVPQIKCDRFIELMPAPGSILASVTEVTPARDEDAEEIFRALQSRGAHAYTPDANLLGQMALFLTGLLSKIPVYARTVRSVTSAVEAAAEWVESKTKFLE